MSRQGRTQIDFGASPGAGYAEVVITGQADITADSLVEAWILAEATEDHSVADHVLIAPQIVAGAIVPGIGFTIFGASQPDQAAPDPVNLGAGTVGPARASVPFGKWSIGWVWNG